VTTGHQTTYYGWEGAPGAGHQRGPGFLARSQLIERWVAALHPRSILEVGCGRGHLTNRIAQHCGRVTAVDLSGEATRIARENCARLGNVDVALADAQALPFRRPFDVVVLAEVLEHLDDDRGALQLATSLLNPEGWLIVTVPANPSLWTMQDDTAGHKRRYTRSMLRSLVATAGFEPVDLVCWGFPLTRFLVLRGGTAAARYRQAQRRTLPLLMRLARSAYASIARPMARLEYLLSGLDRGVGYALLARRNGEDSQRD